MENFNQLDTPITETSPKGKKVSETDANIDRAVASLLASDKDLTARLNRLSGSIELVNTYSFSDTGDLVETEPAVYKLDAEGNKVKGPDNKPIVLQKHKVAQVPGIVGLSLKNIGNEAIPYQTEEWTKGQDGLFTGKVVEKTMKPGETVVIAKRWAGALLSQPEFGCEMANASATFRNYDQIDATNVFAALDNLTFKFKGEGAPSIHGAKVKIAIDDKKVDKAGNKTFVVKPEYERTFGYLMNPKPVKAGRTGGAKGPGISKNTKRALLVHDLMKNAANNQG